MRVLGRTGRAAVLAASVLGCTEGGGELAPGIDRDAAADARRDGARSRTPRPDGGAPGCERSGRAPGDYELQLEHDERLRTYHLHVPPGYEGTRPRSLVLNFHGYTSDASQQMRISEMNRKADAEGFIAVHPEGYGAPQSWNGGACCGRAQREALGDVGLARALVEEVQRQVCVDRRRVYATGFSNGGFLSHRIACEASDLVAAIAPVAGVLGIPEPECEPERPTPVLHFHGTADPLVPYDGNPSLGFPSVPDTFAGWARRNGCVDSPRTSDRADGEYCETYGECDGGAEVTLCTIEGGGHWWPGGPGSDTELSATDRMWAFFRRFERR